MSVRKTLIATAALSLMTLTGVATASAAPLHPAPRVTAAITVQLHGPVLRDLRGDRMNRRHIVSDRVVLANLRASGYRALSQPHVIRGHLVVTARGRFGRIVTVEFNPRNGRMIGIIRL